jgi:hypothetical protein
MSVKKQCPRSGCGKDMDVQVAPNGGFWWVCSCGVILTTYPAGMHGTNALFEDVLTQLRTLTKLLIRKGLITRDEFDELFVEESYKSTSG